eukprot:gnl/TRDRNA2_/TRDRNA2_134652_c4_seq1.p1 gnl/TRDRNA2_/TRDRNA2_134652_c4~~gnl/TRDRNA2_/TRDRNA2_134652_c4_seq1.p1  ORF type:complete len:122 (+),score=19.32 gnl/TRDRNA2_/TRDRNA2_134652_c4_seq1:23-367(+)
MPGAADGSQPAALLPGTRLTTGHMRPAAVNEPAYVPAMGASTPGAGPGMGLERAANPMMLQQQQVQQRLGSPMAIPSPGNERISQPLFVRLLDEFCDKSASKRRTRSEEHVLSD